jgi:hypothetical protein
MFSDNPKLQEHPTLTKSNKTHRLMNKIKAKYELAKSARVGSFCACPSCGTEFEKTNYQQAFCKSKKGTKCKDKYWNTVTPEKRNNTTRISPASRRWTANNAEVNRSKPQRRRIEFGVWHDDDWDEGKGGSGSTD